MFRSTSRMVRFLELQVCLAQGELNWLYLYSAKCPQIQEGSPLKEKK